MTQLYHLSDKDNIREFIPRKSKAIWDYRDYVWAVSKDKLQNYILPRDCPRICITIDKSFIIKDYLLSNIDEYKHLVLVLNSWRDTIENCILYQYEFQPDNFVEIDSIAGYYVSEKKEKPIGVTELTNCPKTLENMNTKLIYFNYDDLKDISEKIIASTDDFSIIRWDNANLK